MLEALGSRGARVVQDTELLEPLGCAEIPELVQRQDPGAECRFRVSANVEGVRVVDRQIVRGQVRRGKQDVMLRDAACGTHLGECATVEHDVGLRRGNAQAGLLCVRGIDRVHVVETHHDLAASGPAFTVDLFRHQVVVGFLLFGRRNAHSGIGQRPTGDVDDRSRHLHLTRRYARGRTGRAVACSSARVGGGCSGGWDDAPPQTRSPDHQSGHYHQEGDAHRYCP